MTVFDGLLQRLLRRPIETMVQEALERYDAEHAQRSLYRFRVHGDASRLHIDPTAIVNDALFNVSSGDITVEAYAFFGHDVAVLTGTHDINKFDRERQLTIPRTGRDVVIRQGAWLASQVLVLGPAVIGANSVVAAGSLVHRDVPPNSIVAGRPAKLVRRITPATPPGGE
jgi:acetyltransferase-like isoleucine patch superfamily enzyme